MLARRVSRKRPLPASEVEAHHSSDTDAQNTGVNFQAEVVNTTTPELLSQQEQNYQWIYHPLDLWFLKRLLVT